MNDCIVPGCERKHKARGFCSLHYQRWEAHGDPTVVFSPGKPKEAPEFCVLDGCHGRVVGRGWCTKHYQRWKKHGDPLAAVFSRDATVEERFWSKVDKNGPVPESAPHLGSCWVWTEGCSDGYGMFWLNGANIHAHQLAHTWEFGEIPEDRERDHLCRNRACCRPDHLQVVAHRVNMQRGESPSAINARKTHCPQGHEYSPENTKIDKRGKRFCRICTKAAQRRWYEKTHPKREG